MNIPELLDELKFYLVEHAMDRVKALDNIQGIAFTYNEHIMKVLLYGNLSTDWKDEIYNHLFRISKYKLRNGKGVPKSVIERNLILDYIESYEEFIDFIDGIYDTMTQRDKYPETYIDYYNLYDKYQEFNNKVLDLIASNSFNYNNYLNTFKVLIEE